MTAIVEGLKYVADLLLEFAIPALHKYTERRRNLDIARRQADIQVLNAQVQIEIAKAELLHAQATKIRAETFTLLEQSDTRRHLDEIANAYIDHPTPKLTQSEGEERRNIDTLCP